MLLSSIVSALLQALLFAAIPFVWWFVSARKQVGFWRWIGLYRPRFGAGRTAVLVALVALAISVGSGLALFSVFAEQSVETAVSEFAGLGGAALLPILFYAVVQTGFSEEVVFRGFLLKRLANRFGFASGNAIQAVLFGLLHVVFFLGQMNVALITLVFAFTTAAGWLLGYLNERLGNGSIVPSWVVHSLSNIIPSLLVAFGMIAG